MLYSRLFFFVLISVFTISTAQSATNLLNNPGFENGGRGWSGIGKIQGGSKHSGKKGLTLIGRASKKLVYQQTVTVQPKQT